jgi:hypothetical protein
MSGNAAARAGGAGGAASGAPAPPVPDDTVAALLRSLKAKPDEGPTPFLLLERFDVRRMGDDDVHTWLAVNAAGAQQSLLFRRHAAIALRCADAQFARHKRASRALRLIRQPRRLGVQPAGLLHHRLHAREGELFVRVACFLHQLQRPVGLGALLKVQAEPRRLRRGEGLPRPVLDGLVDQGLVVVDLAHRRLDHHGAEQLLGPVAALAGEELVAVAPGSDHDGLQLADRGDRGGELLDVAHVGARPVVADLDRVHRDVHRRHRILRRAARVRRQ